MKSPKFSIALVTAGAVLFTILCNSRWNVPTAFLFIFLFVLQVGLIWMVYTILRYGKPSAHTFDERFYDDFDHRAKS